jgi:hypothetical protein
MYHSYYYYCYDIYYNYHTRFHIPTVVVIQQTTNYYYHQYCYTYYYPLNWPHFSSLHIMMNIPAAQQYRNFIGDSPLDIWTLMSRTKNVLFTGTLGVDPLAT